MRAFFYWTCFLAVALASLVAMSLIPFNLLGVQSPIPVSIMSLASQFARPIPIVLRQLVPGVITTSLSYALWALVLRRIWLAFRDRSLEAPGSLSGPLLLLAGIVASSLWLGAAALLVTVAAKVNSGVGAGLILMPGVLLAPLTVFLVELISLVKRGRAGPAQA